MLPLDFKGELRRPRRPLHLDSTGIDFVLWTSASRDGPQMGPTSNPVPRTLAENIARSPVESNEFEDLLPIGIPENVRGLELMLERCLKRQTLVLGQLGQKSGCSAVTNAGNPDSLDSDIAGMSLVDAPSSTTTPRRNQCLPSSRPLSRQKKLEV